MQFLDASTDHNPHPPLSIKNILARGKFTAEDEGIVSTGTAEIRRILALIPVLKPVREGKTGPLHDESDAALDRLYENPSREAAEAAHDAIVRERDAQVSFEAIDHALNRALNREIDKFRPVAERLIDQVRADVVLEGSKLQKQLEAGDKVFGESLEISHFKSRLQRTLDMIDAEKLAIQGQGSALHWLSENGFCSNPYHD